MLTVAAEAVMFCPLVNSSSWAPSGSLSRIVQALQNRGASQESRTLNMCDQNFLVGATPGTSAGTSAVGLAPPGTNGTNGSVALLPPLLWPSEAAANVEFDLLSLSLNNGSVLLALALSGSGVAANVEFELFWAAAACAVS